MQHKHWSQLGSSTAPRALGSAAQTSGEALHGAILCFSGFVRGDATKKSYAAKFTLEAAEKHLDSVVSELLTIVPALATINLQSG